MKVESGALSLFGSSKLCEVRRASHEEVPGLVHMTADTPTDEAARLPMSDINDASGLLLLKSITLPERVAPNGNQQSLIANRTGFPPCTLPTPRIFRWWHGNSRGYTLPTS